MHALGGTAGGTSRPPRRPAPGHRPLAPRRARIAFSGSATNSSKTSPPSARSTPWTAPWSPSPSTPRSAVATASADKPSSPSARAVSRPTLAASRSSTRGAQRGQRRGRGGGGQLLGHLDQERRQRLGQQEGCIADDGHTVGWAQQAVRLGTGSSASSERSCRGRGTAGRAVPCSVGFDVLRAIRSSVT